MTNMHDLQKLLLTKIKQLLNPIQWLETYVELEVPCKRATYLLICKVSFVIT